MDAQFWIFKIIGMFFLDYWCRFGTCGYVFHSNCRIHQVSPVVEIIYYYSDGPLADADVQCFSKCAHSLTKILKKVSGSCCVCASSLSACHIDRNIHFRPMPLLQMPKNL